MNLDPNDPKLTAYALGELDAAERSAVESELAASPAARQELEEIREVATMLTEQLKSEPHGGMSDLQRIAIEEQAARLRKPPVRVPWTGLAVAASLLAAIGAYLYFHQKPSDVVATGPGVTKPDDDAIRAATDKRKPGKSRSTTPDSDESLDPMSPDKIDPGSMPDGPVGIPEEPAPSENESVKVATTGVPMFKANPVKLAKVDDVTWINERVSELWKDNGIKPSAAASDGEFIRRAYLDIVGTIPPVDSEGNSKLPDYCTSAGFIKSRDKDKKAKLIIWLVNSEEYTKYWSGIWSNLLVGRRAGRNIDKAALEKHLRDTFADNKPWNQMVYDLVTASGGSTVQSLKADPPVPFNGATNFLLAHMNDGNVPATAFTTRLFLGVQVQCTQCHDHPFNDRTQEAFWGINAFFQKMRREEHNTVDDTGRRQFLFSELKEEPVSGREDLFVRYDKRSALVAVTPPRLLDGQIIEGGDNELKLRDELARYIIDTQNEYFAQSIVNRMWSHFLGRGIVHPADDLGTHNPASNPDLLTRLAENFRESNYDLKRLIAWITLSTPYSLSSETNSTNKDDDQYFSHYPLKQMSPEQFFDSLIVASRANRAGTKGGWDQAEKMKAELQQQFTAVFNNDENTEADSFNGTIPQALLLMNGNIIQKAISKDEGSYLHESVMEVSKKTRGAEMALLNDLYLAALSRYPNAREKQLAQLLINDTMMKSKDKDWAVAAYQDIFWALLNSSEFVLNH
jgi:hypothetical protein